MLSQHNYRGPNVVPMIQQREQTVKYIVPGIFTGILATVQLVLCITIIILETISVYYDAGRGTIYAGFWCSLIFSVTFISMFSYLCCGQSTRCKNYLIAQNILNLIFTIILLSFTSRFISDPCLCYGTLCRIPNWEFLFDGKHYDDYDDDDDDDDETYGCTKRTFRKLPALRGLLACAIMMLICNIVYITIYTIVSLRLYMKAKSNAQQLNVMYEQQTGTLNWDHQSSREESHSESLPEQYPPTAPPPPYETLVEKL